MKNRSHRVDISGLVAGGRQTLIVDDEVPIETFEGIEFPQAARVHLEVRYVDRLLHIEGTVEVEAHGECDSCLEHIVRTMSVGIDERLDPGTGRDDDPFGENNVLAGDRLDVADLAQQAVLSEIPMGLRCSDECAGLCVICGTNRNTGTCSCGNGD